MTDPPQPPFEDAPLARVRDNAPFAQVLALRLSRRQALKVLTAGAALAGFDASLAANNAPQHSTLGFREISHGLDERLHVPDGYRAQTLIRWGDPVLPGAPAFDVANQSSSAQAMQFGYNNDFIAYLPLPRGAPSRHGLLVVNHEYATSALMFPGGPAPYALSAEQVAVEIMAHGITVVEVERAGDDWQVNSHSAFNRRITPFTPMQITGPAAGHPRLRTRYSEDGIKTVGTYANCAGGVTPWGTVLSAEENIHFYFGGDVDGLPEAENLRRYGITRPRAHVAWGRFYRRWDLAHNPREPLHMGWVVETDPYDPTFTPRKRTALGRLRREGCCVWLNRDRRVVCYMGDDQEYEYIYRFVSRKRYVPGDRANNLRLLDDGILSVAQMTDEGRVLWHPLVYGRGALTKQNGFHSQADVVIDARKAADLVGATPMDRPEEIEVDPVTGTVFVMLTGNPRRKPSEVDAANPRSQNRFGHILEMGAADGDHTAAEYRWELFILAGDPRQASHRAHFHKDVSEHGWFVRPDNCVFDALGRLWIATDGFNRWGLADGIWACDVTGAGRALSRHFLRAPLGAEVSGPCFSPDDQTLFCSIMHPGQGSTFDLPSTRWPDFQPDQPPRPAVVAVTKTDGRPVGS